MEEEIIEITDEKDIDDDFTTSDYIFMGFVVIMVCVLVSFIFRQIRKTFKNVHLKIGNKVEIGVETKEESYSGFDYKRQTHNQIKGVIETLN